MLQRDLMEEMKTGSVTDPIRFGAIDYALLSQTLFVAGSEIQGAVELIRSAGRHCFAGESICISSFSFQSGGILTIHSRVLNMPRLERSRLSLTLMSLFFGFAVSAAPVCYAQSLGWEGETGIFVTPLAYTASAENEKVHAVVAYHYLNAGPVIGDFHEASVEVGIGKRLEFGYTHEFHTFGSDAGLSPLWQNGFDIFNGKVMLVPENYGKKKWVPALSAGFVARPNVRNVGNFMEQYAVTPQRIGGMANGDVYVVASKVVPTKPVPIILSGGVRGTNAELWGMAGNTPNWQARGFGAVAFVFKGPAKSTIILGSEAAQQPHHPVYFSSLNIPTTLTYCVRFVPSAKYKLNFDAGVAQIAGEVMPGANLQARHQVGVQMSYGF
jgi:hypothetical protein